MARTPTRPRRRFRLLPMTMTMLGLLLLIKVNDIYVNSRQLRELYGVRDASAENTANTADTAAPAAKDSEAKPTADAKPSDTTSTKPADAAATDVPKAGDIKAGDAAPAAAADAKPADAKDAAKPDAKDAKTDDKKSDDKSGKPPEEPKTFGTGRSTIKEIEAVKEKQATPLYTQSELDLLQNLGKRRDELDQRERDLDLKAKTLDAGEKRLDDKMAEMKTLQTQLSAIVAQYNDKQSTQVKSLVKIYENMKPGDAANIFNQLDMPILLEVIDKMSERKVAPVLAAMDPKRARDVTQELAEMRRAGTAAAGAVAPGPGSAPPPAAH